MRRPTVSIVKMRVEDLQVGDIVDVRDHNTKTPGPKWEKIATKGEPSPHRGTNHGKLPVSFESTGYLVWFKPFDILPTQQVSE